MKNNKPYSKALANIVKAYGKYLIKYAKELVGDVDNNLCHSMELKCVLTPNESLPEITVKKEFVGGGEVLKAANEYLKILDGQADEYWRTALFKDKEQDDE